MIQGQIYNHLGELVEYFELPDHAKSRLCLAESMRERGYWIPIKKHIKLILAYVGVLVADRGVGEVITGPIEAYDRDIQPSRSYSGYIGVN